MTVGGLGLRRSELSHRKATGLCAALGFATESYRTARQRRCAGRWASLRRAFAPEGDGAAGGDGFAAASFRTRRRWLCRRCWASSQRAFVRLAMALWAALGFAAAS